VRLFIVIFGAIRRKKVEFFERIIFLFFGEILRR